MVLFTRFCIISRDTFGQKIKICVAISLDAGHPPDADDGVGPGGGGVHVGAGHGPVDGALLHPRGDLLVVRHDHLLQAVRWGSRISQEGLVMVTWKRPNGPHDDDDDDEDNEDDDDDEQTSP